MSDKPTDMPVRVYDWLKENAPHYFTTANEALDALEILHTMARKTSVGSLAKLHNAEMDAHMRQIAAVISRPDQSSLIKVLTEALEEIANLKERPFEGWPADWSEQISACPVCQRYKNHPIQNGICDTHRRPIWDREKHDAHETKILGYRAFDIARKALALVKEAKR